MRPASIMMRRLPKRNASRMLWVIIRVVKLCSATSLSVNCKTFSAVLGQEPLYVRQVIKVQDEA